MATLRFRLFCACLVLTLCSWNASQRLSLARSINTASNIVYEEWADSKRERTLPIKIYMPTSGSAPYPVVIFSHGLGGSREAAVYLGDYWSQHGYIGVFVQHPGSDESVWKSGVGAGRESFMQNMKAAANGQNLVDRVKDIKFVLDELERRNKSDSTLKNKMDLSKVALAGHSFGAGTTLAVAGQNFGRAASGVAAKDDRIKAAIYLCPPVMGDKASPQDTYGAIKVPGLLLTGTEDVSPIRETKAEDRRIPFDGMRAPHQYLVNFVGADHAVFGGRAFRIPKPEDQKMHEMIDVVTTQFLDASLKNDASSWRWLDSSEVTTFLDKAAMFERK